ncbi:NAD(P)H-dependent oxidoreductase [Aminobacter sp. MDW-2]|nr:NADPH-dependent oxidoreductase [Aminobacter sp. MDW-2]QNH37083.1 NAD(P)H-dependent oxidoreductase [Aminobacter sp. MDW-2]
MPREDRMAARPLIVGIGGTTRNGSSSERLLHRALAAAQAAGADTLAFSGEGLVFPIYGTVTPGAAELAFVEALRRADGVVVASPGYHGSVSGMVKNALDYVEELHGDIRPYLEGRPVGLIAAAAGWQAGGSTLQHLRSIVHALRGWPTPLGVIANSSLPDCDCGDQIALMVNQVLNFADAFGVGKASMAAPLQSRNVA